MDQITPQSTPLEFPRKKSFPKKIFLVVAGFLVLVAIFFVAPLLLPGATVNNNNEVERIEEVKSNAVIPAKSTRTYRLQSPASDVIGSFIFSGAQEPFFTPMQAYYVSKDFRIYSNPYSISGTTADNTPWCLNAGSKHILSQAQTTSYCLENINNKSFVLRKLDIKRNEFKEFVFDYPQDIFLDSRDARLYSSRDGDSALIYSPGGIYVFEQGSESLYKADFPSGLTFTSAINISNVEIALFTNTNKIFRLNFSSRKGGVFDVNFISIPSDKLTEALKTARLSRDGRRIVFNISDKLEVLGDDKNPNYQGTVAYNIDLNSAKVSEELSYEEKMLSSCKLLINENYCLYRYSEPTRDGKEFLFIKEFDKPLVEVLSLPKGPTTRIQAKTSINFPGNILISTFETFGTQQDMRVVPVLKIYNISTPAMNQIYF